MRIIILSIRQWCSTSLVCWCFNNLNPNTYNIHDVIHYRISSWKLWSIILFKIRDDPNNRNRLRSNLVRLVNSTVFSRFSHSVTALGKTDEKSLKRLFHENNVRYCWMCTYRSIVVKAIRSLLYTQSLKHYIIRQKKKKKTVWTRE